MGPLFSEDIDSFTHDDEEYDLQRVKDLVRDNEVTDRDVDDLKWILEDSGIDKKRIKTADTDNPVIVTRWENKWLVLDGAHRLQKAVDEGLKTLPTKSITKKQLDTCKITK